MADTLAAVVTFDVVSGIIALLVSYYAFQARRLIESSVLSAISFGFMLLGAALLVEGMITLSVGFTAADVTRLRTFELLENLGYLFLQVVALMAIAIGYARAAYGEKRDMSTAAVAGVVALVVTSTAKAAARLAGLRLLLYYSFLGLEFIILLALIFIMFQGFLIYTKSHDSSSLLVLLAFALIFIAHLVVLRSILDVSGAQYSVGAAIQFLGFISLLAFVVRSARIGST